MKANPDMHLKGFDKNDHPHLFYMMLNYVPMTFHHLSRTAKMHLFPKYLFLHKSLMTASDINLKMSVDKFFDILKKNNFHSNHQELFRK